MSSLCHWKQRSFIKRDEDVSFVVGRVSLEHEETCNGGDKGIGLSEVSEAEQGGVLFFTKSNRSQGKNGYVLSIH